MINKFKVLCAIFKSKILCFIFEIASSIHANSIKSKRHIL